MAARLNRLRHLAALVGRPAPNAPAGRHAPLTLGSALIAPAEVTSSDAARPQLLDPNDVDQVPYTTVSTSSAIHTNRPTIVAKDPYRLLALATMRWTYSPPASVRA